MLVTGTAPFIVTCSRTENVEMFHAACVSVGVLGIIVEATLRVEPAFRLKVELAVAALFWRVSDRHTHARMAV